MGALHYKLATYFVPLEETCYLYPQQLILAMDPKRHKSMEVISQNLRSELEALEKSIQLGQDFGDLVFAFPRNKFKNVCIRGFFPFAVAGYVEEQGRLENLQLNIPKNYKLFSHHLPLIFELLVSVQYLSNQVLDGKGGVLVNGAYDLKKIIDNTIAGHALKEALYFYVEHIAGIDERTRSIIKKFIHQAFLIVDEGQFLEKKYCNFFHYKNGFERYPEKSRLLKEAIPEAFINSLAEVQVELGLNSFYLPFAKLYFEKVFCVTAAPFLWMTELLMEILQYAGTERENLKYFSVQFGIISQMTNDIIDLFPETLSFPTSSKLKYDTLNDLRNDNISWPLLFILQKYSFERYKYTLAQIRDVAFQIDFFSDCKKICRNALLPFLKGIAIGLKENYLKRENSSVDFLGEINSVVMGKSLRPFGKIKNYNTFTKTII